ncbi:phosphatase 2C-domain-containing protein [Aspergillus heterothallicus]
MALPGGDQQEGRHSSESSGKNSGLSQETVRDGRSYRYQNHLLPGGRSISPHSKDDESDRPPSLGGPGELYTSMFAWGSPDVSPTDQRKFPGFGSHRKALAVLGNDETGSPPIGNPSPHHLNTNYADYFQHDPNATLSYSPRLGSADAHGTFYHDYSEHEPSPATATFRPGTGRTYASEPPDFDYNGDHRRPSVASATTVSSQGSKSSTSGRFRKRLQGFFGDDYAGDSRPDNDGYQSGAARPSSIDHLRARERANSDASRHTSEASQDEAPLQARPRTPLPSSDITPWVYQNFNDVQQRGEAPVREAPTGPDRHRFGSHGSSNTQRDRSRRRFSGHRHSRSKEEKPTAAGDLAGYPARPTTGRDDFSLGLRPHREGSLGFRTATNSTTNLAGRSTSPSPSLQSVFREQGQGSPGAPQSNKRYVLGKILRRPHLRNFPGSKGPQDGGRTVSKFSRREASPARRGRQNSLEGSGSSKNAEPVDNERRKDGKGLGIGGGKFRGRRAAGHETPGKDVKPPEELGVYKLDTDLEHMEGIVHPTSPGERPKTVERNLVRPEEENKPTDQVGARDWAAPESWRVDKQRDESMAKLPHNAYNKAFTISEPDGTSYFIRVFRIDGTFATLSTGLHATVADILLSLGKKSFLTDHLNNYEILDPSEQPIGYNQKDKIEELGREDHSYILRFTFLPTKLSDYSSLEGEPGFSKTQRLSDVNLAGRSLVTIPIALYKKASEIIKLNLSRNLALDVPKDFIQGCINLREISFSLASRLTYLDVSNNFLEELDHAHLDRLQLTGLPNYFGTFQDLRSLDISSNNFQVFPEFLGNLKQLPNIGNMTSLERIWMTNNGFRGPFDETIKNLQNLKEIDARFNEITNIDNLSLLPRLEQLSIGHNSVSKFKGSFPKLRSFILDHCPVTQFDIDAPMPTLTFLNLASAKLAQLRDTMFEAVPNLVKLVVDKNHFMSISAHIGKLRKLESLSMAKNPLSSLPPTIGCLTELRYLNMRECNLRRMPPEIWYCLKLEVLNVSSNVLDCFPKHGGPLPLLPGEAIQTPAATPGGSATPSYDDLGPLDESETRRPSQASSTVLNSGNSPNGGNPRKPSVASSYSQGGRKVSTASKFTEGSPSSRKDSNFSQHIATTFGGSLKNLYLADNRLEDDIFRELSFIPELRVVNLSYNALTELPPGLMKRWPLLTELYLSGNELTSLPSDDLEEGSSLRILNLNANRFQVLPAELCKVSKLAILDVGSNALKYNVSNWPYDWNWNWNRNLRYLNFSGNKRLEIKPNISSLGSQPPNGTDLTDFNSLTHLRVLGLMDVTLTTSTIPEENEDRRVRTSASLAGALAYGMADFLGRSEHLSIIDMIVPRLKPDHIETVVGMFDGQLSTSGGSKIAKFLHENFLHAFSAELKRIRLDEQETPLDAFRRTFLALNRNMAFACYKSMDKDVRQYQDDSPDQKRVRLSQDDLRSGGVATVLYLNNMDLYVANIGDITAILVKLDGTCIQLTKNHDPAEPEERSRIRAAGGFVSRNGRLNDILPVSRSFGYFHLMPAVIAAPHTMHVNLTEQDEMVVLASKELWDYVTPDLVVDVTRAEKSDPMVAAQKIRDLALSFGATNKLMVMILGVGDLKKREKRAIRGPVTPYTAEEQILPPPRRPRRGRELPSDSRLARFDTVDAPIGELAIIFTDIKQSTGLWETCPEAMRSAIQIHNDILRRQLGIIGGYEVKTEGDAFMVAFSTTTAALLWCFNCQTQLLNAEWPTEILDQPQCRVQYDMENNIIFRGLSVRMGVHWGEPVCEKDPVTNRMDYFGPMVNRASRISAVADGGQIFVSSDFMSDMQRNLEAFADSERAASTGSEESYALDNLGYNIRRELQQLNSQGFVIKDQEPLYLIYPHALSGRLTTLEQMPKHSQLEIQTDLIWRLWDITLRLERLCGALEHPGDASLNEPNQALLADSTVVSLVEQQVTRIEVAISTLAIRHMMRPFKAGDQLNDHAVPIGDILQQLQTQLAEYRALKEQIDSNAGISGTSPSSTATDLHYTPDFNSSASTSSSLT